MTTMRLHVVITTQSSKIHRCWTIECVSSIGHAPQSPVDGTKISDTVYWLFRLLDTFIGGGSYCCLTRPLSVTILSIRLSVCHTDDSRLKGSVYRSMLCITRYSNDFGFEAKFRSPQFRGSSRMKEFNRQFEPILLLARDAFVRTNRRAISMIFVRLSVWDGRALWSYSAL